MQISFLVRESDFGSLLGCKRDFQQIWQKKALQDELSTLGESEKARATGPYDKAAHSTLHVHLCQGRPQVQHEHTDAFYSETRTKRLGS